MFRTGLASSTMKSALLPAATKPVFMPAISAASRVAITIASIGVKPMGIQLSSSIWLYQPKPRPAAPLSLPINANDFWDPGRGSHLSDARETPIWESSCSVRIIRFFSFLSVTFGLRSTFIEVMDEERLLIEAAQKDPQCFAKLYEANFERVYAFIVRRVHDRTRSEDLTSEVFHHALANLSRFEWRGVPFAVWLYRIAANKIADAWRHSSTHGHAWAPLDDLDTSNWEEIERRAALFQLVSGLPEDQRSVIIQRFIEQKSIRDIAREFGRSEGAIKQLQFRALENLRARVGGSHE